MTHAFPLATFQGLFLFPQHRNHPAKGLSHTLITSKSVCLGLQPVWVKTKINCKLAEAACRHARFPQLLVRSVLGAHHPILSLFSKSPTEQPKGRLCGRLPAGLTAPLPPAGALCTPGRAGLALSSPEARGDRGGSRATQGPHCLCPAFRGARAGTVVTDTCRPAAWAPCGMIPHQALTGPRPHSPVCWRGSPPGGVGLGLPAPLLVSVGMALSFQGRCSELLAQPSTQQMFAGGHRLPCSHRPGETLLLEGRAARGTSLLQVSCRGLQSHAPFQPHLHAVRVTGGGPRLRGVRALSPRPSGCTSVSSCAPGPWRQSGMCTYSPPRARPEGAGMCRTCFEHLLPLPRP